VISTIVLLSICVVRPTQRQEWLARCSEMCVLLQLSFVIVCNSHCKTLFFLDWVILISVTFITVRAVAS
jgi:hypothetical protein